MTDNTTLLRFRSQEGILSDSDAARMLKYAEAAVLLRVHKRTVRRRVADGRYIAYGEGSGKRIVYSSLLADIERYRSRGR